MGWYFTLGEDFMWKKPAFIDMRLGLEVTLYISNR
jgi:coenzyme PQQ precursor peptide PqqA